MNDFLKSLTDGVSKEKEMVKSGRRIGRLQDLGIFLKPEDAKFAAKPMELQSVSDWEKSCLAYHEQIAVEAPVIMGLLDKLGKYPSPKQVGDEIAKREIEKPSANIPIASGFSIKRG